MKKTMLLLFGLFTLVACSEDVVPEATDVKQNEGVAPPTIDSGTGYYSPYNHPQAVNYYIPIEFHINLPVDQILITPYLGPMYSNYHTGWLTYGLYPTLTQYGNDVTALPTITPLHLNNGFTLYQDCNAMFNVFTFPVPPQPPCLTLPFLFDFGYPTYPTIDITETTPLAEQCKIYFIYYEFNLSGTTFSGYLRHQLGDDTMMFEDVTSGNWIEYSDFQSLDLSSAGYTGIKVVENINDDNYPGDGSHELALVQLSEDGNIQPLLSEETIVDPASGIAYTIRFRHEADKIIIEVM